MQIRYWPLGNLESATKGPVAKVLQEVLTIDAALWQLTKKHLERAEREPTLAPFEKEGLAENMPYAEPLYEFRFPKKFRGQGVIRIYFCFDPAIRNSIWLLDAERKTVKEKKGKKKQHSAIVDRAKARAIEIRRGGAR